MTLIEFFSSRLAHIFLVYGLAFFVLGVTVSLEIGRAEPTSFSRALWPLAAFGLIHGTHEWVEMFAIIGQDAYGFQPALGFELFRIILLAVSFVALIIFGVGMFRRSKRLPKFGLWLGLGILGGYCFAAVLLGRWLDWQQPAWFRAADVLARYSLAIPGAVLTAGALLAQRRALRHTYPNSLANDLIWVALAFLLYGLIGQFFITPSPLFPSNVINATTFQTWFGIPVQLFRAATACIAAIFTIRALRAFEYNRQQMLVAARQQVEAEVSRRNTQRREFLQRIVAAQEEERSRIARELHDELGQILTGLAVGLRGVQTSLDNPDLLQHQLNQLEDMAVHALDDMRHLVNELRPALLDDMGLPAALRNYVENFRNLTRVETDLTLCKTCNELPDSIKTTLFRVTQESLTNVARHAQATQVSVDMSCDDEQVTLQVRDNGVGFSVTEVLDGEQDRAWGLIGIQERAELVNGDVEINSDIGKGTTVTIKVPKK